MKETQQQIIENYVESYNNFDVAGMTEHMDENVVFENITNGEVDLRTEGLNDFKNQAESAKQFFKQRKQTIRSWEFNDSRVSIVIFCQAVLAIDLPNGLKSGDMLELEGISEFHFENGKIISLIDES